MSILLENRFEPSLERRYMGRSGDLWRRIELERARGYWEENVVLGRRRLRARLADRLAPLEGSSILDLGCGAGVTAAYLADRGARVTGVDLRPCFADWRLRPGVRFVLGDLRDVWIGSEKLSAVVLQNVLEDHPPSQWPQLLASVAERSVPRLLLVVRLANPWRRWTALVDPAAELPTADPVAIFRAVHLHTGYRLVHQEKVQRRNYHAQIADFRYGYDGAEV